MIIAITVILILLLLLILGFGYGMMRFVAHAKHPDREFAEKNEKSKNAWGRFDEYDKEVLNITAEDGYLLHGILIKNASDKYVIITHGWCYNKYGSVKYANLFYELGYNVYIYDLRYFGENKRTYCSMGPRESKDIIVIKQALRAKFGEHITIGLQGESLGCASSLMALGLSQDFSFCVADCGYADLSMLLKDLIGIWFHLPKWMVYVTNAWMILLHHTNYLKIRPMDALVGNQVPILFIHGGMDDFIDPKHGRMNYETTPGPKQLEIFETAKHADAYYNNPERYRTLVREFCNLYDPG